MQNASSVLYRPAATTSQARLASEHRSRMKKLWSRAAPTEVYEQPQPQVETAAPEPQPEVAPIDAWVERQKSLFPPLPAKPLWFSIEAELGAKPTPSIAAIQRTVSRCFDVSVDDMVSARRMDRITLPRHVAFYLIRKMTLRSLPEIGRKFGGRDHSSILHGVRRIERLISSDAVMAAKVSGLIAELEAANA